MLKALIKSNFKVNKRALSRKLKVCERTIKRDVAVLRKAGFLDDVKNSRTIVQRLHMQRMRVEAKKAGATRRHEQDEAGKSFMREVMESVTLRRS